MCNLTFLYFMSDPPVLCFIGVYVVWVACVLSLCSQAHLCFIGVQFFLLLYSFALRCFICGLLGQHVFDLCVVMANFCYICVYSGPPAFNLCVVWLLCVLTV